MAGRFKYGKRYKYTHMTVEESEVWEAFMVTNPDNFESVDYDFRVGYGAVIPPGIEDNFSRMITMLSQKRIMLLDGLGIPRRSSR